MILNPPTLGRPRGFSHAVMAPLGSHVLFIAGQTAGNADGIITDPDFTAQFEAALAKVLEIVSHAGGGAEQVARVTIYVTDLDAYRAARPALAQVWRKHLGRHYPAMTLVEVSRLLEPAATVEIEATAVLTPENRA